MSKTEVTLPDRIHSDISRLVEEGEFVNQEQAIEELLSMGMSAYNTTSTADESPADEWDIQAAEDQQDPGMRGSSDDGRTF